MNGETSKSRFLDATILLNYGYANYQIYRDTDAQRESLTNITVKSGVKTEISLKYEKDFAFLLMNGESLTSIEKRIILPEELDAPIEKNQIVGTLEYYHGNKKLGEVGIIAENSVDKAKYSDYVKRVWLAWMM